MMMRHMFQVHVYPPEPMKSAQEKALQEVR